MPVHADDRVLWIIVGSGLLIAANVIPYYLKHMRTINTANHDEGSSKRPCEDAEAALKLSTLEKLVAGPSYKLRSSAVKIIAERSTRGPTRKLLLQDLASQSPGRREQALHALWFLLSDSSLKHSPEVTQQFSSDTAAFSAIIECLANLLPLHQNGPAVRADNPTAFSPLLPLNRPPSETTALRILRKLLTDQNATIALAAGLVSKWLKQYPFPCTLTENGSRRQEVVKLFKTFWRHDDPLMAGIMAIIAHHPEGLKQLRRHGLTGSSYGEAEIDFGGIEDIFMTDGEDTAGVPSVSSSGAAAGSSWSRRPLDPSSNQAERAVRQRRREAAVYSEGNAPLTQDNIFQRQPSNTMGPSPGTTPEVVADLDRINEEYEREHDELVEALEEVRDRNPRRQSGVENMNRPRNFWQWLTMNSGRARPQHRHPLAELESTSNNPRLP
jgi:hypothetical protein